jgi:hypothetical protein
MIELLEAERGVAECNALIERQRQLIERLAYEGPRHHFGADRVR